MSDTFIKLIIALAVLAIIFTFKYQDIATKLEECKQNGGTLVQEQCFKNDALQKKGGEIMQNTNDLRHLVKDQQEYGSKEPRRVVCAACRWPDGHIILGIRHYSPDMRLSIALQGYNPIEPGIEQGFVDQFGCFLTRQEAFKIALSQGQYRPYEPYTIGTFYSEDLY